MANVPQINTGGIQDAEGLLGQLFGYIQSLSGGMGAAPQVAMRGLPKFGDLNRMVSSFNKAPMMTMPGGGVDPASASSSFTSGNLLSSNPARAQIQQARSAARQGIQGQNLQLQENDLFNNQTMSNFLNSLLSGAASGIGQLGTYPPLLRGMAKETAAGGTGGGGGFGSMFGF